MKQRLDVLIDIPCFMCMFWKSERETQLLCRPAECEELTEWLEQIVEVFELNHKETARKSVSEYTASLLEVDERKVKSNNSRKKQ